MIKHLVQSADKNSQASHTVSKVNIETQTLQHSAKSSQLALNQAINIYSYNGIADKVIPELFHYRADMIKARQQMDQQIIEKGEVTLKEIKTAGTGGVADLIAIYLRGAGYESSLAAKKLAKEDGHYIDVR